MLIMLDGVNGVGKSTYAYKIKDAFGINVCRTFRSDDKELHWGDEDELQKKLEALKVPINTHVDDLFMADFIRSFQVDAVLDRTLVSAIAYGRVYNKLDGWYREKGNSRQLLEFWISLIGKCKQPAMYVWMDAEYDVAKKRCDGRQLPNRRCYLRLKKEYERVFSRISFLKMRMQTDFITIEDGVSKIMSKVMAETCQRLKK